MKKVIYGLFCPKSGEVRYIGYTSKGISKRLAGHIGEAKKDASSPRFNSHRHKWIRSLLREGLLPQIEIIEEIELDADWQERERFWIEYYGKQLTNATAGGEGLINPSKEVRKRIGEKVTKLLQGNSRRAGIAHTEESKKAISDGMKNSEKFKKTIVNKKGMNPHVNFTEEQKKQKGEKISKSKTGVKRAEFTEEHRKNMSDGHKGIPHPESSREKKRGRRWATNGFEMKQLLPNESLPDGFSYGMLKKNLTLS